MKKLLEPLYDQINNVVLPVPQSGDLLIYKRKLVGYFHTYQETMGSDIIELDIGASVCMVRMIIDDPDLSPGAVLLDLKSLKTFYCSVGGSIWFYGENSGI